MYPTFGFQINQSTHDNFNGFDFSVFVGIGSIPLQFILMNGVDTSAAHRLTNLQPQ